jgi:PAS domain S-box-containing protein
MKSHDMEQNKVIESAHESEEKYRNLIENISDWVWETDGNLKFTYTNPRIKDYLGYAPADVLGRSMYELMSPEWVERIKNFLEAMTREGRPVAVCEKVMVARSGELVFFEMTVNLVFDENGRVKGYRGICRDIRDRKRAEEAQRKAYGELERMVEERTKELEHARATLQVILDTAPIGILVVDAETNRVTYHSSGVEKIFGGPLIGKTYGLDMYPLQLLHPDGTPMQNDELPIFISLKHGKFIPDIEVIARRADGNERTIMVSSAPIKDAQGRITSAVAAIADITRLKIAERGLHEAKAEAEMYLDLMGHDINNLSQVGIGYLELALNELGSRGKLELKDRLLLEKALETQMNSSKLIDNVRKIQRSRAGGLKFRPIDICEILADLKGHYSHVPDRDVDISLTGLRQCFISTNELIRDVFANLISNSIKHSSPDHRLKITIDLRKIKRDGKDFYEISIEDNGPGIPDDLKSRLFTRFERGQTKASGRGLGLYLVKTLLEDMNGSISVEDRVKGDHHKGARFVVILPATAYTAKHASESKPDKIR